MSRYIESFKEKIFQIIEKVVNEESPKISEAADLVTECLSKDGFIYVFGAGHSMILALDIFYRAGGIAQVYPMLDLSISAYNGALKSTMLEKLVGYGKVLVEYYNLKENSILILVSNSGNSVVPVEVALEAKRRGAKVIALTSVKYSQSLPVANPFNKKLYEVADVFIDNKMPPGDAVIEVEGTSRKVAPVSTIINSFILQSLVATIVDKMLSKGTMPAVWLSAHLPGAEETNKWIIEKYFEKIKPL